MPISHPGAAQGVQGDQRLPIFAEEHGERAPPGEAGIGGGGFDPRRVGPGVYKDEEPIVGQRSGGSGGVAIDPSAPLEPGLVALGIGADPPYTGGQVGRAAGDQLKDRVEGNVARSPRRRSRRGARSL